MKLRASVDTFEVAYIAELSEAELKLILRSLTASYWNYVTEPEEDVCKEICLKIRNMLPPTNNVVAFGAVENGD